MSGVPRRLIRALVAGASLLLAVLLVAILALRLYGAWRLDTARARFEELGPLELTSYAPALVRDRSRNAAFWLQRGAELLHLDDSERELVLDRLHKLDQPWSGAERDAMATLLQSHESARRLLSLAGPLETSSLGVHYEDGAAMEFPNFSRFFYVGQLLAVECDFRLQQGEPAAALEALRLLERLAAVQERESLVVLQLTGALSERLYLARLAALLGHVDDPGSLEGLERDLSHLDRSGVTLERAFLFDGAWTFGVLSDHRDFMLKEQPRPRRDLLQAARYDRLFVALQLETFLALMEHKGEPFAGVDDDTFFEEEERPRSRFPLIADFVVEMLAPTFSEYAKKIQATRSARLLAGEALSIRRSRLTEGAYPDELATLPTSPYTGETAVYARLPGGGVEIAFPVAERLAPIEVAGWAPSKLRWRLPP